MAEQGLFSENWIRWERRVTEYERLRAAGRHPNKEEFVPESDNPRREEVLRLIAEIDEEFHEVTELPSRTVGDVINGRYELLEKLGQGGFGVVFKGWDQNLGRTVAVKLPRSDRAANSENEQQDQFVAEARNLAAVHHPNVVTLFDFGCVDGIPFLISQYVEGCSLWESMAEPVPESVAADWVAQMAEGIEEAHRCKVVHRDLNPGNVLIDAVGRPHVTDFGLARRLTEPDESGSLVGTPGFMAPEQSRGDEGADHRADVYALGVILYRLLAAQAPFTPEEEFGRAWNLQEDVSPPGWPDHVPGDLVAICRRCLERDPADRYQTAEALAQDLRCFLAGLEVSARPLAWPRRFRRWVERYPTVATLSTILVVVLVVGLVLTGTLWRKTEHERQRAEVALDRSEDRFHELSETISQLSGVLAPSRGWRPDRAITDEELFQAEQTRRRLLELVGHFEQPLDPQRDLILGRHFVVAFHNCGWVMLRLNDWRASLIDFRHAERLLRELLNLDPHWREGQKLLALNREMVARALRGLDRYRESAEALDEAERTLDGLLDENDDCVDVRYGLMRSHFLRWQLHDERGDEEAMVVSCKSLDEVGTALVAEPLTELVPFEVAWIWHQLGKAREALHRREGAIVAYERAAQVWGELNRIRPENTSYVTELSTTLHLLSRQYRDSDRFADAEKCYRQTLALRHWLTAAFKGSVRTLTDLAFTYYDLAQTYELQQRWSDAVTTYESAVAYHRDCLDMEPTNPNHQRRVREREAELSHARQQVVADNIESKSTSEGSQ